VHTQLREILENSDLIDFYPARKEGRNDSPYAHLPMLGHLAIYSLNLVILNAVLSGETCSLDQAALSSPNTSCQAWDRLVALWRSWIPLNELSGAVDVILTSRHESQILISYIGERRPSGQQSPPDTTIRIRGEGKLRQVLSVAAGLSDDITTGLAGIAVLETADADSLVIELVRSAVERQKLPVNLYLDIAGLKISAKAESVSHRNIRRAVSMTNEKERTSLPFSISDALSMISNDRTPGNIGRVSISPTPLASLSKIGSRYDAENIIGARTAMEPRWLPTVVRRETNPQGWTNLLSSPAGAPLLREACNELPNRELVSATRAMTEIMWDQVCIFDPETACWIINIGARGRSSSVCAAGIILLRDYIEKNDMDVIPQIPTRLFAECTDVILGEGFSKDRLSLARVLKKEFRRVQPRKATVNYFDHPIIAGRFEGLIHCMRIIDPIEAGLAETWLQRSLPGFVSFSTNYPSRALDRTMLALLRYARESAKLNDVIVQALRRSSREHHRTIKSGRAEEDISWRFTRLLDDGSDLSAQQIEDLKWASRYRIEEHIKE
jgi:hypothetical protein